LSPILTAGILALYYFFEGAFSLVLLPYSLILLTLINLSFIDCKYFEISGHSYWFLLLPTIAIVILSYETMILNLASFLILFGVFWIIDKIVGIEKIGGADVKILLILALTVSFFETFSLLAFSFLLDTVIFMFKFTIDKIINKEEKIRIPMIVSITLTWIVICLMNVVA
jgi:hypothetical protein